MRYSFTAPAKDPSAVLRHAMDWTAWLDPGETITAQTAVASPAGLTVDQVGQLAGVVSWRVSGGVLDKNYTVTVTVTTSAGRSDQRSVLYRVRDR
jgi:hypothetical protein